MKLKVLIATFFLLVSASGLADRDPALAGFFAAPLSIETTAGDTHSFNAYLAVTTQQRIHGLMFVRDLPANYGMLFLYEPEQVASMWMKNTVLPLDILFIRGDGTITNIARNTTPGSLEPIRADGIVRGVLELNAGTCKALGIEAGDRVIYRAFDSVTDEESQSTSPR